MSAGPLAFLNGRTVPAAEACLPVHDAGIVHGAIVTEQLRTFRQKLYRLEDHLSRLTRSLEATGLSAGLPTRELAEIACKLVEHNSRFIAPESESGLIILVTPGLHAPYGPRAALPSGPTVCIHTFPLPLYRWAASLRDGVRLVISSIRQVPPDCWPPQIKHRSRLHFYLAERQVRQADPGASALLLDQEDNVAEAASANFFMVRDGILVSPTITNILPGISRGVIIEHAARLAIPFVQRDIPAAELAKAEEAMLTSTPYCILPVTRINGAAVGTGCPGAVFRRLLTAWSKEVGVDIEGQIQAGSSYSARRA